MRKLLLTLAAALCLTPHAAAQGWPMQHGNAQHTSSTSLAGFDKIKLAWTKDLGVIPNPATKDQPQSGQGVSVAPDGNLIVSASTAVYKINSATGDLLWTYAPGSAARFTQALVDANRVYVASSGLITALNQATGAMVWQIPVDAANQVASTRMSDGAAGFVTRFSSPSAPIALTPGSSWFLITGNDQMTDEAGTGSNYGLLSVSTGGFVHSAKHLTNDSISQAAIARDGSVILAKTRDTGAASMRIYAFDSQFNLLWSTGGLSGRGEWGMALGTGTLANPTAVFFPVFKSEYRLGAYNMATGAHIWTSTFSMSFSGFQPGHSVMPVYDEANNRVYMTDQKRLYAYDAATGNALWTSQTLAEVTTSGPTWSVGTPLVAGSTTVLVSAIQRASGSVLPLRMWNIDSSNGAARWSVAIASITGSPGALLTSLQTPQIVPGTGAFFAYSPARNTLDAAAHHHYITRYEPATYDAVTVTTGTPFDAGSGVIRVPGLVRVTQAGAPVAGVPVTLTNISEVCGAGGYILDSNQLYFSGASSFTYHTDSTGYVKFFQEYDAPTIPVGCYESLYSTASLSVPGMTDPQLVFSETRVSTYTISYSSPSIEFNNGVLLQVTTVTVSVKDPLNAGVPGVPVRATIANYAGTCNATVPESAITPSNGFIMTDGSGNAAFTHRLRYTETGQVDCQPALDLPNTDARVNIYVRGATPALNRSVSGVSPSTYTVSFSTPLLTTDIGHATMTVTVFDAFGSTIPGTVVYLKNLVSASAFVYSFGSYMPAATCTGDRILGYTNALGQADFLFDTRSCATFDNFNTFLTTAPVFTPSIAVTSPTLAVDANYLEGYAVSAATLTSVGVAFRSTVTAVNHAGRTLPRYNEPGVTLTPLFDGTAVQGTGSLGTGVISFAASNGQVVISSQTYNKIENIQIKATRGSGSIKTGLSGTLVVNGPTHFIVTIPTSAAAGVPFSMTVRAVDASSTQVVGYSGTIALSALNAGNQSLAGAGVLGTTNINMPANGVVTIANQTYTKAESIVIRASDSGAGVVGVSTYSAVVGAGTPASITLLANPQSTIAGVPSVLTATVLDGFSNPVSNSTATFSVATGSGVVSLSLVNGSVVSAVTSTQAVTDAFGQTQAFFSSTNSLSAQANVLRASIGALARDTTVYSTVLVTSAGGAVVNFSDPSLRADVPANTYGFSVRLGIQGKPELSASDLALTTAAFAATPNTFVSTTVLKLTAVRDSSPSTPAGAGSNLVTVQMPFTVVSGSFTVGAYGAQSLLVPLSVARIFKLNSATSVFEQVLDGLNAVNAASGTVTAQVSDPDGIYVVGAPAFTSLTSGSSATVTTALSGGTSAEVLVPQGGFSTPVTLSVTVPGSSSVPALPAVDGLSGTGITISVSAGGAQPSTPVTIKIGYTPGAVAGINPDHLKLARYDASTGWVVLDSAADTATRQVIGQTDHFSLFQIVAQTPGDSIADGFVFPNPYRPSRGHTNVKFSSLPASAHVKIYTASGRLLKELDADASGQVLNWNGTDRDGRVLASGVYLAVVEGTGGRRTIKFAVQR